MVYLLQHRYCPRCVQKTGESFPVCCIVASQLSPSQGMMCPNNLGSTSVAECHSVWQSPLAGLCPVLGAGAAAGPDWKELGRDQCPTQPCPCLQTCTRGEGSDLMMQMA